MAQIVRGIGTSHTPQLSVPWTQWGVLQEKDRTDPRLDYAALVARAPADISREITPEVWRRRSATCDAALAVLRAALAGAVEELNLSYVQYEPCYRSPAATGCGMAFATWN